MKFAKYFDRTTWIKSNGTLNEGYSLTDQSFKSMCEIEQLLVNYKGTPRTPVYDMENYETSTWTFEDWQNEKAKIERKFLHLDEKSKAIFKTPQEFFRYCSNPDNYEIKDGKLLEKSDEIIPSPVVGTSTSVPQVEDQ